MLFFKKQKYVIGVRTYMGLCGNIAEEYNHYAISIDDNIEDLNFSQDIGNAIGSGCYQSKKECLKSFNELKKVVCNSKKIYNKIGWSWIPKLDILSADVKILKITNDGCTCVRKDRVFN